MRRLRCMRETFLKFDTSLNDELIHRGNQELVSLHTIKVSNKDALNALRIKSFPLFRGDLDPWSGAENTEMGDLWFSAAPSLEGGLILDKPMRRSVLDVGSTTKFFSP